MKHIKYYIALLLVIGCTTTAVQSFQNIAGKFLVSSALTVDGAMRGWAAWVAMGRATDADQIAVKNYYVQYQAAFAVATNAYTLAISTGNTLVFAQPSNNVFATQAKLVTVTKNPSTL